MKKDMVREFKNVNVIDTDWNYDRKSITMSFPKKWSKKMIKRWLLMNDYPIEDEYYHICSMYDCTGQITSKYVDYRKNHVTFTEYYDV